MKQGCCSGISPCSHQQKDPTTLCQICQEAEESYGARARKKQLDDAIRVVESNGYVVTKHVS